MMNCVLCEDAGSLPPLRWSRCCGHESQLSASARACQVQMCWQVICVHQTATQLHLQDHHIRTCQLLALLNSEVVANDHVVLIRNHILRRRAYAATLQHEALI